jgi:hypothetical protein
MHHKLNVSHMSYSLGDTELCGLGIQNFLLAWEPSTPWLAIWEVKLVY